MPLKCYWGQHDRARFEIAPLYRGPDRATQVNDPAMLFYCGRFQPAEDGTLIDVNVRWSRPLMWFAFSWYGICLGTILILVLAIQQTVQQAMFTPSMLLLGVLPVIMVLLLWLPMLAYVTHHAEEQRQYLTALFQEETIPTYQP